MIDLDYADKRPVYEQTKEKLRELIITGVLMPHEKIPSVRELAASLSINPNTIQKAYRELEQEGYIYSVQAKGNYVSPKKDRQQHDEERKTELYAMLESAVNELRMLGEKCEDIKRKTETILEKGEKSDE